MKQPFDPVAGCQGLSTGILGGLFILLLVGAYFDSAMSVAETLVVHDAFPWLPAAIAMPAVSREPLVLLAIVAMGALFVASWELLDPRRRPALLVVGLLVVGLAWHSTLTAQPLLPGAEGFWVHLCGLRFTRLEAGLVYGAVLLVALDGFFVASRLRRAPGDRSGMAHALRTAAWRWLAGLGLFTGVLAINYVLPLYGTSTYESWRLTCLVLFSIYLFLGLPYAFVTNLALPAPGKELQDPGVVVMLICRAAWRAIRQGRPGPLRVVLRNRGVRVALRDLLVKLFFVPVMTISFFLEASYFSRSFVYHPTGVTASGLTYTYLPQNWYSFIFFGLGLAEVCVGMLGYLASSRWLGNKSISVDPTFGGWLVAVACYPPFNAATTWLLSAPDRAGSLPLLDFRHLASWLSTPTVASLNQALDFSLSAVCLVAYFIYVLATLAFGLRFSNMTHRGILTRGPYGVVRHPAYVCKMIVWWGQSVRTFTSPWQLASMLGWTGVYLLRALTEERHLRAFADYQAYCKRVRWRFIPGIY